MCSTPRCAKSQADRGLGIVGVVLVSRQQRRPRDQAPLHGKTGDLGAGGVPRPALLRSGPSGFGGPNRGDRAEHAHTADGRAAPDVAGAQHRRWPPTQNAPDRDSRRARRGHAAGPGRPRSAVASGGPGHPDRGPFRRWPLAGLDISNNVLFCFVGVLSSRLPVSPRLAVRPGVG